MAADVSYLVRMLSGYEDDRKAVKDSAGARTSVALMTRDLLGSGDCGGGGGDKSLELDLDMHVPNGWEKHLDLKSGKVYLQQCKSTKSSSSTHHHAEKSHQTPISDNSPAKPLLSLFGDTSLELKLVPSSISRPPPPSASSSNPSRSLSFMSSRTASSDNSSFQSVCTLDKVKSALERAEKDSSRGMLKKRQSPGDGVCDRTASVAASLVAVGCPNCLSYVLVMKNHPKCPRCRSFVPLPAMKKPKIDLNISI